MRFQASILAHKKETVAETVQQKREEAATVEKELNEKRKTLQDLGGEVLKGDEVRERHKYNLLKKETITLLLF